ncbi:hypothetical protein PIB30_092245 [Stylosanthes scabra]|uniref:Uncharacterized protein n=1 Tax=Stylosanthes scabra TaxID=79078 RepID=A0ABU6UU93_9FABA|nr:hypothetical protein [Stylosanthes scabra]
MVYEAQLANMENVVKFKVDYKGNGLSKHELNWEGSNNSGSDSTDSCLYPPGFEPIGDPSLMCGAKTRVADFPQIESGEHNSVRLGVNQGSDKEESDKSLYRINEEANGWLMVRHDAYAEQVLEQDGSIAEPVLRCPEGTNIAAEKGALLANDNLNSAERSPSDVDGVVADESSNGSSVVGGQHIDNVDAKDVESEDEDGHVEASETKVWDKGGISFYSSDEEEVLARLAERKIVGKGRIDLRPRKQK